MKANGRFGKFSFIIFISTFLTHLILLSSISDEINNAILVTEGVDRSIKTFVYFLLYSFFPGGAYFVLVSFLLKKPKYIKYLISFAYLLIYFSWTLFVLIYNNYAGVVPQLKVLVNPQEVTSVVYHILHQFIGVKELCIFGMMLVSLYASVPLIRKWNVCLALSKRKKIFVVLFFVLNFKGLIQYTINWDWPWQLDKASFMRAHQPILSDRNVQSFRQGFILCYLWLYFYEKKFLVDTSTVKYPGPINKSVLSQKEIPRKKYNIITIQVESLAKQVIELRDNLGQEITPFLNKLKRNSLYFTNFYAQHGGGYSSDAELALFLSLIPMDTHPGISTAKTDYIKEGNLVSILKDEGYETAALHGHDKGFFNREKNYAKIGIEHFYDSGYYHGKAVGFHTSKDMDFFQQSIPKIKSLKQPFYAHLITLQSHGPFKNYNKKTLKKMELSGMNTLTRDYLASLHEVSNAIEKFFESMEEEGILENTIVLLYGDHVPGIGINFDKKCPEECIPLFIYAPKIIEAKEMTILGTHLDLAPTILDILGIVPKFSPKWLGSSLLNDFSSEQIALLPRNKRLVLEKNGIVRKPGFASNKFLKFYHYSNKILYSN